MTSPQRDTETKHYSSIPYLNDLNPPQREAVLHHRGPLLVLAGAGSGKTRVLTRRVVHLVLEHGVRPENILAVTFTNKATDEMRARLRDLLGMEAERLWVSTFHAAALKILRRHAHVLGYDRNFQVYDEQDSKAVLDGVLKECNIDKKRFPIQSFARAIDRAKNAFILPEHYVRQETGTKYEQQLQAEVYDRYQRALLKANAMDFGDLLVNVLLVFQRSPETLSYYAHMLSHILVDEFQDTNKVQYLFIKDITRLHKNILVVGDDDQSIYAFRGAHLGNLLGFEHDFPGTKIVVLDQNYRSTANILEAAYQVIRHNRSRREKKLWTAESGGAPLYLFVADDEMEEANFVADQIVLKLQAGIPLSEIAIFYRTNAQSRALEEALLDRSIPYRIFGGLKFYERKEIKDILAYLRLILSDLDSQALLRTINTPPRGIGAQTANSIVALAAQDNTSLFAAAQQVGSKNKHVHTYVNLIVKLREEAPTLYLSELIHTIIERTGYAAKLRELKDIAAQSRLENLQELEAIGRSMESMEEDHTDTLRAFLDRVTLSSSADIPEQGSAPGDNTSVTTGAVSLMTLHLAKGLEFAVVFLTGMEEGLLPHYLSLFDEVALEEERRLCYVGITRAMRELYLTRAVCRGMFASGEGSQYFREPSRYTYDIPEELVQEM